MTSRGAWGGVLVIMLLIFMGACDGTPFFPEDKIHGRWGGEGFGLVVSADSATAVFTCAYGTLETPIVLGVDRRFFAQGEYVREVGPAALRNPATYEGRVSGSAIELVLVVTDTIGPSGTYTLGPFAGIRGGEPKVSYCQ